MIAGGLPQEEEEKILSAPQPRQEASAQNTERRKNFGSSNAGWMKVEISEHYDEAFLQVLSFGGDTTLGRKDVFQALEDLYGIRLGIDHAMVERLADQAASSSSRVIRGHFLIASSSRSGSIQSGGVRFTFMEDLPEGTELPYAALHEAFAREKPEEVLGGDVEVRIVLPGEEVAAFVADGEEQGPRDIFGNFLPSADGAATLKAGSHVQLMDERFLSEVYGYACVHEGEISVIPPVWVSADHLEAYFIHFPQVVAASPLTRDWLDQILELKNVKEGLRESAIEKLLNDPPDPERATFSLIACGTFPAAGDDGRIDYTFEAEKEATVLADGSIDLQARDEGSVVKSGQLLAEVSPSTEGESGINLAGNIVSGVAGERKALKMGENVRSEYEDKIWCYYTKVDGNAKVRDGVISVRPVVYIDGNVNTDMNFNEEGADVRIKGSVRAGVNIRAGNSISIDGMVEAGASVQAQGDVVVAKGVIGHYTKIVALGDLETKFVQQGSVVARGNIDITSHLVNARVRAGGKLVVSSAGGERGNIVGGQVYATTGIEVGQVGSATEGETSIGISPDPEITARLRKLDKGIDFCKSNILRVFRTLGMSEINVAHFRELIEMNPPHKRKPMMKVMNQLKELAETREKSIKMRRDLEGQQDRSMEEAEIKILDTAFAGVKIQIGNEILTLEEDVGKSTFTRTPDGIERHQEE